MDKGAKELPKRILLEQSHRLDGGYNKKRGNLTRTDEENIATK